VILGIVAIVLAVEIALGWNQLAKAWTSLYEAKWWWLLAAVLAVNAPPSVGQPAEGTDYKRVVPPQPTDSPGRIEVIEFFSYGCPHCNAFYPVINAWAAKLPKDVVFKRVAVSFNRPQWISLARAYYALQATGDLPALDGALFHALHAENLQLFDEPRRQVFDEIKPEGRIGTTQPGQDFRQQKWADGRDYAHPQGSAERLTLGPSGFNELFAFKKYAPRPLDNIESERGQ